MKCVLECLFLSGFHLNNRPVGFESPPIFFKKLCKAILEFENVHEHVN